MKKISSQKEVDSLLRASRARSRAHDPDRASAVVPWERHRGGRIKKGQLQALQKLHELFAGSLTRSLGSYLGVPCAVKMISVEALSYDQFLRRVPEVTYLATVQLQSPEAFLAVQFDLSLGLPVVDVVLGGPGKMNGEARDLTEIEEGILESVSKIVCSELATTWKPSMAVELEFDRRQGPGEIPLLWPPGDEVLSVSLELRLAEVCGLFTLVFPESVTQAILRNLTPPSRTRKGEGENTGRIWQRLLGCRFPVELALAPGRIRGDDLLVLTPGEVLALPQKVEEPAIFSVGGEGMFLAHPVRSGNLRGAQIQQPIQVSRKERREGL